MATAIVSIALLLAQVQTLSQVMLGIACVFLLALIAVYLFRVFVFTPDVWRDLRDPTRVFGFFTVVAACGVVATRFSLGGWVLLPAVLTVVAFLCWVGLIYWTFGLLIFTNERPIDQSVNGSWLIAIVGTESLAITWVLLARVQPNLRAELQLLAYAFWTFGVLLYLIFIGLIVYRFAFFRLRPSDLTPPYWINMGAMAITTVAGIRLLQVDHPAAFLVTAKPYIEGFSIMMWAWGTWWIPLLIIIGIWKYLVSRELLTYDPSLWSVVFPLGMYAVAVELLSRLPGLSFLHAVDPWLTWIAFTAWVIVALSWLWASAKTIWHSNSQPEGASEPDKGRAMNHADDLNKLVS